jgi:TetR/AcrR family transcriptional regulator
VARYQRAAHQRGRIESPLARVMAVSPCAAGARSILDAALTLFAEEGFDGASIAAIAERAGVSKANVFHHYPSKEALYFSVLQQATAVHADYAEELFRAPMSSAEKIKNLLIFEMENMLENPQRTRLLLRQVAEAGHERVHALARKVFQRNFTAVVRLFEQGQERGEFLRSVDCGAAAMLLCGATQCFFNCHEVLREFRDHNGLEKPDVYAERAASLILIGVVRTEPQELR